MGLSEQDRALIERELGLSKIETIDGNVSISQPHILGRLLNAARAEEREHPSTPDARDNMLGSIIETSVEQGRAEAAEAQTRRISELEAGIRLIVAAATGKGHALSLIAKECRALLPADTKEPSDDR